MKIRNGLALRAKTTERQTTIRAYIREWRNWIQIQRIKAKTLGMIKDGLIDSTRSGNLDEFAMCPEDPKLRKKHIAPANALMINADSLLVTINECKRIATIFLFAPMCGWKECLVIYLYIFIYIIQRTQKKC